eukprot:43457_1
MVYLILYLVLHLCNGLDPTRPNFIFFLTDDQDLLFDSMLYMPFTLDYFEKNGITFTNSFISTTICCPSRTESITGRTYQNIRQKGQIDCMDIAAQYNVFNNTQSMFQIFQKNGYITSSFGKLTNNMNKFWCEDKPPLLTGFDRIQCPCDYNNFYGIQYMNKYMNGTVKILNLPLTPSLHETPMVGNSSLQFIDEIISDKSIKKPFISWIGVHAPHFPADPTDWYSDLYPNATAPRTPNFNVHASKHHGFVSTNPKLDSTAIEWIDQLWRDRLRSLLSVDDLMRDLVNLLETKNILNNTYILFSSDHGYHLGQWRVPCSKQQIYETDIRIPTYMSGPNIGGEMKSDNIVSNTDFLPTFLDLANIKYDVNTYDGMSWVQGNIINGYNEIVVNNYNIEKWRDTLLIQYGRSGKGSSDFSHCQMWWPLPNNSFPGQDIDPVGHNSNNESWYVNGPSNVWRAIRILNKTTNVVYAEFVNNYDSTYDLNHPNFTEYYNIIDDPYQMNNLYYNLSNYMKNELHSLLMKYAVCNGTSCW